ncbi:MAG TPA: GntR family transcriptional regulator [Hypericibacter adhaerens]|uniref:GntR family transcriptional regulator n=1 Tax=Hypericibacter adhaerens TaxID=2602016 RepID=UPI002C2512BF|nr:GntR family transcriptional regulator [Hypericibacter adhaerens]HWA42224.1 GntR family transcriptional regulator [Hypericibacter adhaerens]
MAGKSEIIKRSLDSQVADILRRRIVSGELANGARLTEMALAAEFGLSRGPIRAALQQLANEQLVRQKPYSHWEVRRLTKQDVWELNTLRSTLEALAARLAAQNIDAAGADALRTALGRLREACAAGDRDRITDADFDLHRTIVELARHERLRQAYLLLEQQVRMLIIAVNAPFSDLRIVDRSHDAMIEAICQGDSRLAERLVANHNAALDDAMLNGAENLPSRPAPHPTSGPKAPAGHPRSAKPASRKSGGAHRRSRTR